MNQIDTAKVAKSFAKASKTYKKNAIVQEKMRSVLIKMLKKYGQTYFENVFEFGVGNGEFSEILQENIKYKTYTINDINPPFLHKDLDKNPHFDSIEIFDMNALETHKIFAKRFDLIASNACLQWLDTHKILRLLSTMLKPNGILLLSTFGEQNLCELEKIASISLRYASTNDIKTTLENACEVLDLQEGVQTLDFGRSIEVFRHLQKSGVNALNADKNILNKSLLKAYQARFGGLITYHSIYILARKKV